MSASATDHVVPPATEPRPIAATTAASATAGVEIPSVPGAIADRVIRVLLVDDHLLVRAGLRSIFDRVPDIMIVGEAASGEEAVAMVEQQHPDVVVMDLDMPGEGGLGATKILTTPKTHPSILVLTMHPEDERLVEALRAGASGYLTKTVAERELITAVRVAAAGEIYVRSHVGPLLAAALRRPTPRAAVDDARAKYESLSEREQTVLRFVAEGHSGPEIGRSLGITSKTVDTYRHRIQEKIGLAHRTDYIRLALSLDLLKK